MIMEMVPYTSKRNYYPTRCDTMADDQDIMDTYKKVLEEFGEADNKHPAFDVYTKIIDRTSALCECTRMEVLTVILQKDKNDDEGW